MPKARSFYEVQEIMLQTQNHKPVLSDTQVFQLEQLPMMTVSSQRERERERERVLSVFSSLTKSQESEAVKCIKTRIRNLSAQNRSLFWYRLVKHATSNTNGLKNFRLVGIIQKLIPSMIEDLQNPESRRSAARALGQIASGALKNDKLSEQALAALISNAEHYESAQTCAGILWRCLSDRNASDQLIKTWLNLAFGISINTNCISDIVNNLKKSIYTILKFYQAFMGKRSGKNVESYLLLTSNSASIFQGFKDTNKHKDSAYKHTLNTMKGCHNLSTPIFETICRQFLTDDGVNAVKSWVAEQDLTRSDNEILSSLLYIGVFDGCEHGKLLTYKVFFQNQELFKKIQYSSVWSYSSWPLAGFMFEESDTRGEVEESKIWIQKIRRKLTSYGLSPNHFLKFKSKTDCICGGSWYEAKEWSSVAKTIYESFFVLDQIRKHDLKAISILEKTFGIRFFHRYPWQALLRQAKSYYRATTLQKTGKNIFVFTTVYDHNGAMVPKPGRSNYYNLYRAVYKSDAMVNFFEFDSTLEFITQYLKASRQLGIADVLTLNSHTSTWDGKTLDLGSAGYVNVYDLLASQMWNIFSRYPPKNVIIESCLAGLEEGFAYELANTGLIPGKIFASTDQIEHGDGRYVFSSEGELESVHLGGELKVFHNRKAGLK